MLIISLDIGKSVLIEEETSIMKKGKKTDFRRFWGHKLLQTQFFQPACRWKGINTQLFPQNLYPLYFSWTLSNSEHRMTDNK